MAKTAVYDYSTTASSNSDFDGTDSSGATGKVKDGDNYARSIASHVKGFALDLGAANTVAGTGDAITVTLASNPTALVDGMRFSINAPGTNTGAATIAVTNSGATLLGTKKVRKWSGGAETALSAGDITSGHIINLVYDAARDSASGAFMIDGSASSIPYTLASASGAASLQFAEDTDNGSSKATLQGAASLSGDITITLPSTAGTLALTTDSGYPTGHLHGLTLSNNGSDATNDIDIAAGTARDSTDTYNMVLASALTKRLDASWAVGTNQGMLDGSESSAGTPDTSTWYHIWLIKRSDTGVVDVLASESATAPTLPTNYDSKRRIGAVYNNSSGDILAFDQYGDTFVLDSPVLDASVASSGTTAVSLTLTVPGGVVVEAFVNTLVSSGIYISSLASTDLATSETVSPLLSTFDSANANAGHVSRVFTNTSSQIRYRAHSNAVVRIATLGWVDRRGRT